MLLPHLEQMSFILSGNPSEWVAYRGYLLETLPNLFFRFQGAFIFCFFFFFFIYLFLLIFTCEFMAFGSLKLTERKDTEHKTLKSIFGSTSFSVGLVPFPPWTCTAQLHYLPRCVEAI